MAFNNERKENGIAIGAEVIDDGRVALVQFHEGDDFGGADGPAAAQVHHGGVVALQRAVDGGAHHQPSPWEGNQM